MSQWGQVGRRLWIIAALGLAIGCKKDPASEGKKWEQLKQKAGEQTTVWPKFKSVVDAKLAEGQKAMDETASISDPEKQGEAMAAAIDVPGKLVNRLGEVKSKSEAIESSITKLNKIKLPKDKSKVRNQVVAQARESLVSTTTKLGDAAPTTEAEAMSALGAAVSALIATKGKVDRAIKTYTPKTK